MPELIMVPLHACRSSTPCRLVNCCICWLSMNNITSDLSTWCSFSMTSTRHFWHSVVIAHCWFRMEQFSIAFSFLLQTIRYWIPSDVVDDSLWYTIQWNDSWNNNNNRSLIPFQSHSWFLIVGFSYIESWYWLRINNSIDAYSFVDENDKYLCQIEIFW